jgi:hypothetical protein
MVMLYWVFISQDHTKVLSTAISLLMGLPVVLVFNIVGDYCKVSRISSDKNLDFDQVAYAMMIRWWSEERFEDKNVMFTLETLYANQHLFDN